MHNYKTYKDWGILQIYQKWHLDYKMMKKLKEKKKEKLLLWMGSSCPIKTNILKIKK